MRLAPEETLGFSGALEAEVVEVDGVLLGNGPKLGLGVFRVICGDLYPSGFFKFSAPITLGEVGYPLLRAGTAEGAVSQLSEDSEPADTRDFILETRF
jgi:hypothetical protein